MNIPKNKDETFYADINIFFSTYLPVYIHKVFNFVSYGPSSPLTGTPTRRVP